MPRRKTMFQKEQSRLIEKYQTWAEEHRLELSKRYGEGTLIAVTDKEGSPQVVAHGKDFQKVSMKVLERYAGVPAVYIGPIISDLKDLEYYKKSLAEEMQGLQAHAQLAR